MYSDSETILGPLLITRGPDDNMWFTYATGGIGRVNVAGTVESIVDLDDNHAALDLTTGLDGALWFTEPEANMIGRLASLAFEFAGRVGILVGEGSKNAAYAVTVSGIRSPPHVSRGRGKRRR
jgi:streptogramin lyase